MGTKNRPKTEVFDSEPYDDYDGFDDIYDDEFDDSIGNMKNVSKDFYSTDWEDPSGPESRFSTRRKIERRNDLKELYSNFDDGDELDFGNEW